jgi:hypothetical protein
VVCLPCIRTVQDLALDRGEEGVIGLKRRDDHGYFVDCQYEYLFVGDSHYHGFLSDDTGYCIDPLAEKGMRITAERIEHSVKSENWNNGIVE